ncbi:PhzF family phenazine biosynthesis protein [Pseudonocardia xishanensis]|uniref:PhzF family phenazine biosynthesis protein n=1 Tax=Pseudonocardia xishanensis TaxID=630995 RepID=A0ABP8S537_9PSEU
MGLHFDVVDVFTGRAYAGNPLAVVRSEEQELSTEAMQRIAGEFHLSETVFTLPPTTPEADYRVRIFTPAVELPFAGHPSVGAAWVLARDGMIKHGDVVQECGAGLLPVFVDADGARVAGGRPEVGDDLEAPLLADAAGLTVDDVDGAAAPGIAAAGVPFAFLLVRPDAVARAAPDAASIGALGLTGLVVVSVEGAAAHLRMFGAGVGVDEDPATGSAAVALGVFLADRGLLDDGESTVTITQGVEMGRPSLLELTVQVEAGVVRGTTVRGGVVAVSRGELTALP